MNYYLHIVVVLAAVGTSASAFGHGHPIVVTQADNRLVVSGGVAGADDGLVNQIYVETGSEGDPQDFADFANFGPGIYWAVPGFDIFGLAENSGLYLETLARPVRNTNPVESRTLWYWNPNSPQEDKVELAPASSRLQIRQTSTINMLLTPTTAIAPPAMKLAEPVAADMGFHNHDLVRYVLPAPLPDDGAYAFFARLTSDIQAPSDPFLVVINNGGLGGAHMLHAAAAINRAALLAGDYNHDDRVDAADYVLWRKTMNSTSELAADGSGNGVVDLADYDVWRENFGLTFPATQAAGMTAGAAVPEPSAVAIAAIAIAAVAARRRAGTARLYRPVVPAGLIVAHPLLRFEQARRKVRHFRIVRRRRRRRGRDPNGRGDSRRDRRLFERSGANIAVWLRLEPCCTIACGILCRCTRLGFAKSLHSQTVGTRRCLMPP